MNKFQVFSCEQFSFEQFLDIIGSFGIVQPESVSIFPFQYNIMFGHINLSSPIASLPGEVDICAY